MYKKITRFILVCCLLILSACSKNIGESIDNSNDSGISFEYISNNISNVEYAYRCNNDSSYDFLVEFDSKKDYDVDFFVHIDDQEYIEYLGKTIQGHNVAIANIKDEMIQSINELCFSVYKNDDDRDFFFIDIENLNTKGKNKEMFDGETLSTLSNGEPNIEPESDTVPVFYTEYTANNISNEQYAYTFNKDGDCEFRIDFDSNNQYGVCVFDNSDESKMFEIIGQTIIGKNTAIFTIPKDIIESGDSVSINVFLSDDSCDFMVINTSKLNKDGKDSGKLKDAVSSLKEFSEEEIGTGGDDFSDTYIAVYNANYVEFTNFTYSWADDGSLSVEVTFIAKEAGIPTCSYDTEGIAFQYRPLANTKEGENIIKQRYSKDIIDNVDRIGIDVGSGDSADSIYFRPVNLK